MLRRMLLLLTALALMLCSAAALAESPQDAALALHPGAKATVLAEKNDAVALALTEGDVNILCMVEKIDGAWTVTIDNPTALRQGSTLPTAYFDTDGSLLWRYDGYNAGDRDTYQALQKGPGQWGTVSLMCERLFVNGAGTTFIWWEAGRLRRAESIDSRAARQYIPVPAAWMEDAVSLQNFDCESDAFPIYEDYDCWPGREAMAGAAAELFPGMTFKGGSVSGYGSMPCHTMEFLLQKANGALVLECVLWDEGSSSYQTVESTPLPRGTYYGVENFTNSIGLPGYGAVTVECHGGQWGISEFWPSELEGDSFFAGPNWVGESIPFGTRRIFGENAHWQDITRTSWDTLPATWELAAVQTDFKSWAAVNNPNPEDRLHLRAKAERGARSLGKYYNGTPVRILQRKGDWARVSIGGTEGWMMAQYLAPGLTAGNVPDAFPARFPLNADGSVTVCASANASGPVLYDCYTQPFAVIGLLDDVWYHVWLIETNEFGYIRQSDVWAGNG